MLRHLQDGSYRTWWSKLRQPSCGETECLKGGGLRRWRRGGWSGRARRVARGGAAARAGGARRCRCPSCPSSSGLAGSAASSPPTPLPELPTPEAAAAAMASPTTNPWLGSASAGTCSSTPDHEQKPRNTEPNHAARFTRAKSSGKSGS